MNNYLDDELNQLNRELKTFDPSQAESSKSKYAIDRLMLLRLSAQFNQGFVWAILG